MEFCRLILAEEKKETKKILFFDGTENFENFFGPENETPNETTQQEKNKNESILKKIVKLISFKKKRSYTD